MRLSFINQTQLCLLSSLLVVFVTTTTIIFAQAGDDDAVQQQKENLGIKIDSAKCRQLGFASPSTSAPPACGTCDILTELLKATDAEKQLPENVRKSNKATKKQFVSECKQCCVPGSFEEDAESTLSRGGVGSDISGGSSNAADGSNVPNVNSRPASGSFVSATLEVDRGLAENTAHTINRFIRLYSATWDKTKISIEYKDSIPPRLHLKRPNGKIDIVNVGSWEPELIWEYLRKGLIA